MTQSKYPVEETKYPTPFDEEIAAKVKWFKENYRFIWKTIQSAPSELSFKIFMLSHIREDHVKKLVEEINYSYEIEKLLSEHPDISVEDLEWCLSFSMQTPKFLRIIDKRNRLKEEQGNRKA